MGDFLVMDWFYRSCVVIVLEFDTRANIIVLYGGFQGDSRHSLVYSIRYNRLLCDSKEGLVFPLPCGLGLFCQDRYLIHA